MKTIDLGNGKVALVDDEDLRLASTVNWYYHKRFNSEYAIGNIRVDGKRTTIELHRFLLNPPKGVQVDHRDENGLNCQRYNLRLATISQNARNRRYIGKNRFGMKGLKKIGNKWEVQICTDFGRINLGAVDREEAENIYRAACLEFHGEFANLR